MSVQVIQRGGGRRFGPSSLVHRVPNALESRAPSPAPAAQPPAVPAAQVRTGTAGRSPDGARASAAPAIPQHGVPQRYGRVRGTDPTRPHAGPAGRRPGSAAVPCRDGSAPSSYRMGRWARLSMTIVVTAAIIVGTLTLLGGRGTAATRFVTVQPGDTLMSVAVRDMPGWDPARAIAVIESLNHLDAPAIGVGTVLRVPAEGAGTTR